MKHKGEHKIFLMFLVNRNSVYFHHVTKNDFIPLADTYTVFISLVMNDSGFRCISKVLKWAIPIILTQHIQNILMENVRTNFHRQPKINHFENMCSQKFRFKHGTLNTVSSFPKFCLFTQPSPNRPIVRFNLVRTEVERTFPNTIPLHPPFTQY